jgi:hypothetical protein
MQAPRRKMERPREEERGRYAGKPLSISPSLLLSVSPSSAPLPFVSHAD